MIKVTVEHDGYNWVAIPECGGTTTARCLEQLADRVCEVVEMMTGRAVTADELQLEVRVAGAAQARKARAAREAADVAAARSAALTSLAVGALRDAGCSVRDIGTLVGISHQRVHQLVGQVPPPASRRRTPTSETRQAH